MKKNFISPGVIFSLLMLAIGCNENSSDEPQEKPYPNNPYEKPISASDNLTRSSGNVVTTAYSCGASFTGNSPTGAVGYYSYPPFELDLSGTPQGSTVTVNVSSYDIPNRFLIKDTRGYVVAYTDWMGYSSRPGPWGPSLNTPQSATLTFTTDLASPFTLVAETVINGSYDYWHGSFYCAAPALTVVNTSNVGEFHNNALAAVDQSFTSSGVNPPTLEETDNYARAYEIQYFSNSRIDVSESVIAASFPQRNKLLRINYQTNSVCTNVPSLHIADSLLTLQNTSVLLTDTEKLIVRDLFGYFDQYQNGQIDYHGLKGHIGNLKNVWSQQGFNAALHQGDISAYTLNVADASLTFWYNYDAARGGDGRVAAIPGIVVGDAIGALAGGLTSGLDSWFNTGKVNWRSVGAGAIGGAVGASLPALRIFKKFYSTCPR